LTRFCVERLHRLAGESEVALERLIEAKDAAGDAT